MMGSMEAAMKRPVLGCIVIALAAAGCSGSAPTAPAATPATLTQVSSPGDSVTFSGLKEDGVVASYAENGFTVTASGGTWAARTGYGNPRPFVYFNAAKDENTTGRIEVAAGGATFHFKSVDLYASIIPIPYTITGLRNGAAVFTLTDTIPNTFGQFRTVSNPNGSAAIDTLRIELTNAPPCCVNPMGIDTLVFGQ